MADSKKAPRRTIPAAEKAQRALDVVDRQIERFAKQEAGLKQEQEDVAAVLVDLRKRRTYLAQNPDLPSHTEPTLPDEDEPGFTGRMVVVEGEPGPAADDAR